VVQPLAEKAASRLRELGLAAHVAVRDGEPGASIVAEAKEWGGDLIVVGPNSHHRK
jgi:nucleotide-binding universal stress UspA family protein